MVVESLMSKDVKACGPDQTLADAAAVMWKHDVGCVPVVDADGRLKGIITDRDICMAGYRQSELLERIAIGDAMTRDIVSCEPGTPIKDAEERMQRAQVRRLPVVDSGGQLVGILSLNDIAREADRMKAAHTPEVGLDGVALTLSAVCQPAGASASARVESTGDLTSSGTRGEVATGLQPGAQEASHALP